jgi:YfiR/HmsC-like
MNQRLVKYIFLSFVFVCFSSCISKKKYNALEKTSTDKNAEYESKLKTLASSKDSLSAEVAMKQAQIDSLILINFSLKKEKEKQKPVVVKKASTLTKNQEYDKKAQFIYNFGAYIEWPVEYNGTDFVVGVAGDLEVIKKLQKAIGDKKVKGKKIRIEKYIKGAKYNIIYLINTSNTTFASIKEDGKKNKTLFVCDDESLYNNGAHIVFLLDDDKVRYLLNKITIEKVGLKVSQELMRFSG